MNQLNETLGKASVELLSFAVMFAIVFTAFSSCGTLLFGNLHKDYLSFFVTLYYKTLTVKVVFIIKLNFYLKGSHYFALYLVILISKAFKEFHQF